MPIVKSIEQMFRKYSVKYSGDNVTAALTAVKPIMEANYQAGSTPIYDVVEKVRALLMTEGVPSTLWGIYLSFAQKLMSKSFSFAARTLELEAVALKQEWITAHGANSALLDKIIELVLGAVPPY